ncbi:hypothetical protein, partial [Blastococcus sp. SYSU D01042]
GCPVCGSVEHPEPARPGGPVVTRDQEDAAHVAAERSEARWSAAREVCATTVGRRGAPSVDPVGRLSRT